MGNLPSLERRVKRHPYPLQRNGSISRSKDSGKTHKPAMPAKPTMEDVAQRAGVSRSLVSLVFQDADNVSDTRRAAVLQAAAELGYRPNRLARNLAQGKSLTIGAVVDDLHNPFFGTVIDGVEQYLGQHGYQLMIANGARDAERTVAAASTFNELQVDGLILVGARGPMAPIYDLARRVPTAMIARQVESDLLDSVRVDEHVGCRLIIDHLHALGHQTIVHIDGGEGASAGERREGYEIAMRQVGLGDRVDVVAGEFTHEAGAKAAVALAARSVPMPDAVFAGNDLIATGVWLQLERMDLSVPSDVSLVGYDDAPFIGFGQVGLTTIRQPSKEIGSRAAELLLDRIDETPSDGRHEAIAPILIERASTRATRPASR